MPATMTPPPAPGSSPLQYLVSMGFPEEQARAALATTANDLARAADFLLNGAEFERLGPHVPIS